MGGMTLSMPRMIYAFARDGYLPRFFAAVQPRSQAPVAAIVLHVGLTFALAITGTFEKLAILANASALALYFGCAVAAWQLRRLGAGREPGSTAGFRVPMGGVIPVLACGVILWLLTGLARDEWLAFGACLAGATLLYIFTRRTTALAT
jgi:amino acid transporter